MKKQTLLWVLAVVAAMFVIELATVGPRDYPLPATIAVRVADASGRALPAAQVRVLQKRTTNERPVILLQAVADERGAARAEIDLVGRVSRGWIEALFSMREDSVRRRAAVAESLSGVIVSAEKAGWATSSVVLGIDHVRNRVELLANTLWRERGRLELEVELTLKPDDAGSKRR